MTQTPVRGDVKSLAGKSIIYGVGGILLKALSFFLLPLYTRHLTPSDYGIIGVTTAISTVLGILFPSSLHGALLRFYFITTYAHERRRNAGTPATGIIAERGDDTPHADMDKFCAFVGITRDHFFDVMELN